MPFQVRPQLPVNRTASSIGVCIARVRGFAYSRYFSNIPLESTGANRALDLAHGIPGAKCGAVMAARYSGSRFCLALLAHTGASPLAVVDGSEFLSRIFCSSLLRLRHLAGAPSTFPHHATALVDWPNRAVGWLGSAHRRPLGSRTLPRPLFAAAGHRWSRDPFSGMESVSRTAVSVGIPAADDSHPTDCFQPDYVPVAVACLKGGCRGSAGAGRSDSARRQR